VISRTSAVIAEGGVLRRVEGRPPLTLRRIDSERRDTCALALVGTAAGPLAGDDLVLELHVEAGARATLQATGAHLAQGAQGAGAPRPRSRLRCAAFLGAGATLAADPGPLVVCAGGSVDVEVALTLGPGAAVDWRELVVLGRMGEPAAGDVGLRWDVLRTSTNDGNDPDTDPDTDPDPETGRTVRPLLRQRLDLADQQLARWGGLLRGRRVLASRLLVGPEVRARTIVDSPLAVAQQLADDAVLITVLADDAADAIGSTDSLAARSTGLERESLDARLTLH
jgi:urease accessory protein